MYHVSHHSSGRLGALCGYDLAAIFSLPRAAPFRMNKITWFGLATIQIQYILVCTNLKANENNCKSNINSILFNRIAKLDFKIQFINVCFSEILL